jgi:hypothetical protein
MEILHVVEVGADERVSACITFDPDDYDAAFAELDARYLAGEAAPYWQTWSVVADVFAALARREITPKTPDRLIDHRRGTPLAHSDLTAIITTSWNITPDLTRHVETVHLLSNFGAVFTQVSYGRSQEGFDAEWRMINLVTVEGDLITRTEIFDESDLDAAVARFDELCRPAPRLENAASRIDDRFDACFAARDWDAMADMLTDDTSVDDRRRVVNAGIRRGRDVEVANMRTMAGLGVANATSVAIATRGQHLALSRTRFSGRDQRPEAFHTELLGIVEIDADERIVARVAFDPDDIDAAFEELDARYLAGEAAAHSRTWSVIVQGHAAFNRRELTAMAPYLLDHRPIVTVEAGDPTANIRAMWDFTPDLRIYIETVHLLSDVGAVFTQVSHGTSQVGFDAEWRIVELVTIDGDRITRGELFEETDVDAALARFHELSRPAPRLENAASDAHDRVKACFAARDWDGVGENVADDIVTDDRRRVVNAGRLEGRTAAIAELKAIAEVGVKNLATSAIATRGRHLVLSRLRAAVNDEGPNAFHTEALDVVESRADGRVVTRVVFDPDDLDAAFEELDGRYLAGEADAYAHTWSLVTGSFAAMNRRELPETIDWVDHRKVALTAIGEMTEHARAAWNLAPHATNFIEAVHRLSSLGAVVTHTANTTSHEGLDAEWRAISLLTFEGNKINRCELFDEADLDAALARFDELSRTTPRLENAASQLDDLFKTYFAARDWDAMTEILADHFSIDDRRRVVNIGIRNGRDLEIANMRAAAEIGSKAMTFSVIATRGKRLALSRIRASGPDQRLEAFHTDALGVVEIDADNRIAVRVAFDPDDIDAAFEELDARYLAGEAATHSHLWSVVAGAYATLNRHELPPITPDFVSIDHRRGGSAFAPGDLLEYVRASWDDSPDNKIYVEAVHRLSNVGAVVTSGTQGASLAGFNAEWRELGVVTVDGDMLNRTELFDEDDLDTALARFDELSRPVQRLQNTASHVDQRFWQCFAACDWDALNETVSDDILVDDRRRVINAGVRHGRDAHLADVRAIADIGALNARSTVIATRGERLALTRVRSSNRSLQSGEISAEVLSLVEIDADNRILARVGFDLDDTDAAFEELNARYLAGEAAGHADMWSLIAQGYAAMNRYEVPTTTPEWVTVDHRKGIAFMTGGDLTAYIHSGWDVAPRATNYVEAVHRLGDRAAVYTHAAYGTSPDGFDVEWRMIALLIKFDSEPASRCELFDETDIDAALARFDELDASAPQLENAATRTWRQIVDAINRRDADGFHALSSADGEVEDRRKGLRASHEGSERRRAAEAMCRAPESWHLEVEPVAIRGYRLGLTRERWRDTDEADRPITVESLTLTEVTGDELAHHTVIFDPDDIDAAFEELDARYLADEAAAHAHTWSVIVDACEAINRHELPPTTPDWANVDRRRVATIAVGDQIASLRATWDLTPDFAIHIETVHRLTELGAAFTYSARGTSQEGFDAEWREIAVVSLDGGRFSRSEIFDEADLGVALARFDELSRQA